MLCYLSIPLWCDSNPPASEANFNRFRAIFAVTLRFSTVKAEVDGSAYLNDAVIKILILPHHFFLQPLFITGYIEINRVLIKVNNVTQPNLDLLNLTRSKFPFEDGILYPVEKAPQVFAYLTDSFFPHVVNNDGVHVLDARYISQDTRNHVSTPLLPVNVCHFSKSPFSDRIASSLPLIAMTGQSIISFCKLFVLFF